jgi:hypothetical protein
MKRIIYIVLLSSLILLSGILSAAAKEEIKFGSMIESVISEEWIHPWKLRPLCPQLKYPDPFRQEVICYMWGISGYSMDFILTMLAENNQLTHDRKHNKDYWCAKTGTWETDWGFGISACYHRKTTDDPRFFTDWRWQAGEAWRLYSGGTRFYGHDVRGKHIREFNIERLL